MLVSYTLESMKLNEHYSVCWSNVGHAFLSYVHHKPDKTGMLASVLYTLLLVNISVYRISVQQIRDEGGGNGNFTYL